MRRIDPTGLASLVDLALPALVITFGGAVIVQSQQHGNDGDVSSTGIVWPSGVQPNPISPHDNPDLKPEARVPADILPPRMPDVCQVRLDDDLKRCNKICGNIGTKAACVALARVVYFLCIKGKGKGSPGDGGGGGDGADGPTLTPGGF